MGALDSLYLKRASYWPQFYAVMQRELGNTATLIDFGNIKSAGQPTATTWTGRKFHASGLSPVWTPNAALSGYDTPFDLKLESNWLGYAPQVTLNGTSESFTTPDDTYFSRGNGTTDSAFSFGAWLNVTDTAAARYIWAKLQTAANLEWRWFVVSTDVMRLELKDDSAAVSAIRDTDAAIKMGQMVFFAATYDGTGGATAANGIVLYENGASVASTATNNAGYVAMENLTARVNAFQNGNDAEEMQGKALGGPWSPFYVQAALTAAQIANIYQEMRLGLGV